jgi:hypothetical protein
LLWLRRFLLLGLGRYPLTSGYFHSIKLIRFYVIFDWHVTFFHSYAPNQIAQISIGLLVNMLIAMYTNVPSLSPSICHHLIESNRQHADLSIINITIKMICLVSTSWPSTYSHLSHSTWQDINLIVNQDDHEKG